MGKGAKGKLHFPQYLRDFHDVFQYLHFKSSYGAQVFQEITISLLIFHNDATEGYWWQELKKALRRKAYLEKKKAATKN